MIDRIEKPVLDIIGGEDSRRKASTEPSLGVYPAPTAETPSPIVPDTFENTSSDFCALVSVSDIDHFDLVDDPFVVAYRTAGGTMRPGAFDPQKTYVLRPLEERQQIRNHYTLAALDRFLNKSQSRNASRPSRLPAKASPSPDAGSEPRTVVIVWYLERRFTERVGLPIHVYLQHVRLARAKALLRGGESLSTAAVAVGFSDQPHMTRTFRRCFGLTPRSFQRAASF
jgi:hypothetical protein